MNKKLLFGIMSLAALTACTNDEFESQKAAENVSPIQFEVVNGQDDAFTRASMKGNKIVWNANDGDLFTLYHGGAGITGYENAIYTAKANEGATATLTTPSMIKQGSAVMVWPVDTAFRIGPADNLSIEIPADQKADIENYIPYMSDQVTIGAYTGTDYKNTDYNTAGYQRKYPVFMRPMASQLIVKADYVGTDETIATLYKGGSEGLTGEDAIDPIKVTSVKLLTKTGGADEFTTNLDVKWTAPGAGSQWATVANNAWTAVTDFNLGAINVSSDYLETECLTGNKSAKFLILPQNDIAGGVDDGAVVVNTIYGKVFIGDPTVYAVLPNKSYYTGDEYNKAWYRYLSSRKAAADAVENASATSTTDAPDDPDANGKYKTVAKDLSLGMQQTINVFSGYKATTGVATGEPIGVASTRYVEVRLDKLDMSDLHIKSDKQLRDAARVWKKMNLAPVTVYLDGVDPDGDGVSDFVITQKTIEVINTINAGVLGFKVKPCQKAGEICDRIVITGSDYKQAVQDIAFIADNSGFQADVVLANEGTAKPWKWNGKVLVTDAGVEKIINEGTMENAATATLQTFENGIGAPQNNIPFVNNGTWNINAPAVLNVQFNVTNNGEVNIASGAQYRQDGRVFSTTFVNEATDKPSRFGGDDSKIGVVINKGVFATVAVSGKTADINNYGLIEHADVNAKTYITRNQTAGANFTTAFADPANKMGRINLPYSNRMEDNVSISAALTSGFVSVTIDGEVTGTLTNTALGNKVNYVIVKSGVTDIASLAQVDYLEINSPGTEIAWSVAAPASFVGLMILSDVNIKLGTTVKVYDGSTPGTGAVYLGADMYVGGKFNNGSDDYLPSFVSYYGDTDDNFATKYITY
jgi:hypothetical protein